MTGYVEPRSARHRVERVDGVEQLRIPPRRMWFALVFLPVWLVMWTFGGIQAIVQETAEPGAFLAIWLVFWAVGWTFAASTFAMQVAGAEWIRVERGDLVISAGIGPLRRSWRYRGAMVRDLVAPAPAGPAWWSGQGLNTPFFVRPSSGAVSFSYGADTIHCASGVDQREGRAIVNWLALRLPRAAAPAA